MKNKQLYLQRNNMTELQLIYFFTEIINKYNFGLLLFQIFLNKIFYFQKLIFFMKRYNKQANNIILTFIILSYMNSNLDKGINKVHKSPIPFFLQSKVQNSKNFQSALYESKNSSIQFEQQTVHDTIKKALIHKRVQMWVKNTPKVIILSESTNSLRFQYQCPRKLLLQNLVKHNKIYQFQKAVQAILALFHLANDYGYFYCDRHMIKISKQGIPIVWIHQNFRQTYREFPISQSPVAELIFVKKIKKTFQNVLSFPKHMLIETKQNLLDFLEIEKKKMGINVGKNPELTLKHILLRKQSQNFKGADEIQIPLQQQKSMSLRQHNFLTPQRIHNNQGIRNSQNERRTVESLIKRNRKYLNKSRQRLKTTSYSRNIILNQNKTLNQQNSCQKKSSYSNNSDFKVRSNIRQRKIIKFICNPQRHLLKDLQTQEINCSKKSINEDTIIDELNLQVQAPQQIAKKIRKNSADPNILHTWNRLQNKMQQKNFQNSTFSTRVTFSSIKGQFQANQQQKTDLKHQIPHLYSINKQKQLKQKLNEELKRILKSSGMKIAQQDSFENQVENLFQSQIMDPTNKIVLAKLKQSQLAEQFEKLFQSRISSQRRESSIITDLQKIL